MKRFLNYVVIRVFSENTHCLTISANFCVKSLQLGGIYIYIFFCIFTKLDIQPNSVSRLEVMFKTLPEMSYFYFRSFFLLFCRVCGMCIFSRSHPPACECQLFGHQLFLIPWDHLHSKQNQPDAWRQQDCLTYTDKLIFSPINNNTEFSIVCFK